MRVQWFTLDSTQFKYPFAGVRYKMATAIFKMALNNFLIYEIAAGGAGRAIKM